MGSLALHALSIALATVQRHPAPRVLSQRTERAPEIALDFEPEPAPVAAAPEAPAAPSAEPLAGTSSRQLRAGRAPQLVESSRAEESAVEADSGEAVAEAAAPPATPTTAPGLTLAQLGVDGQNPFLDRGDPAAARAAKARTVKRRLDRALAQGLTNADVARGHGAHGPVLRTLEAAVYASNAPLNGQASFVFVIDGAGKVVSASLGNASGDRSAWLRVAQQTAQSLGKLPVKNGQGVKVTVAVSSHLELPSGADPGVEVSLQGLPLKKGGGPRSTRLDLSVFPFPALTMMGDPADLDAKARRMVHAHVVSEELL